MPAKDQTLCNPHTGDTYTFRATSADTGGSHIVLFTVLHSKGPIVPRHFHVHQDETFEVIRGELTIVLDGETRVLGPGQSLVLPKGRPHNHFNAGNVPVEYLHTVSPALDFEYLVENLVGLAMDGKGKNGKFGLLQELVTLRYLDSKSYLADIPVPVQHALMYALTPLARLLGYRAIYRKYSGFEK